MKTVSKSASKALCLSAALGCALAAQAGSLWPAESQRGMTSDRRASRVGDILTVVVAESATASSAQTKSANRDSSLEDAIGQFIYSAAVSGRFTHKGELPSSSASGKSSYSGGGQVNNSQTLTARAAVLVTDVLPNGNLVIEGARMVTFSGETQHVVLRGVVRAHDVSAANTVLSSNVADARVEFLSEGTLTEAQKRGWLSKLYEKLRPF
ncbi:flagellar basal body L-ring protein FlgH [Oleiharenicola lentus]|jgi:flagellar L-ring protein precursor FlgH|uniref:Flagellar L-ring protein n=1 Tax=Oleiharenicola lentus TaxID=2508720 RepID=A0A4Q1C3H1_9BACT|nr:flagellar basal body L-ring protein FlgH [Oleiharenicola lentus]RXK52944.1 flagellar basal body L-ring protein FlgH [Oleiharenicola lentus]